MYYPVYGQRISFVPLFQCFSASSVHCVFSSFSLTFTSFHLPTTCPAPPVVCLEILSTHFPRFLPLRSSTRCLFLASCLFSGLGCHSHNSSKWGGVKSLIESPPLTDYLSSFTSQPQCCISCYLPSLSWLLLLCTWILHVLPPLPRHR